MTVAVWLFFFGGLALLVAGAEALVRGASRLAAAAGVSPLVIGLTVVAFGTSAPELAVSAKAALADQADISLGNVVGSNIFNVLFILGLSALVVPLTVGVKLIRLDVPIMIGTSFLLFGMSLDGAVGPIDGAILLAGILAYTTYTAMEGKAEAAQFEGEEIRPPTAASEYAIQIGLVLAGLAMLVLGSTWLVDSAIEMARWLGVSERVVGLTIVAAGTSLPELATSVVASIRGERDIAVGNVVGSNIFNIFAVLGVASVIGGGVAVGPAAIRLDLPVMIVAAFVCLPVFFTGKRIDRWEGALFVAGYVGYTAYLVVR